MAMIEALMMIWLEILFASSCEPDVLQSQSKQVEEVTCILWILSNFQLFVPSGSVEFYQELQTSECTLIIIHAKQAKNTWVQSYD
ncbi:hypothetical protein QQP08_006568 [Theobroma cacao]|nr:hypothetical protein QQP08_006568 [Theobroma cacao]